MSDKKAPIPKNEFDRLLKLSEYDIDYSEMHKKLNDLTRLAAHVAGTPISLINLLEANTQWTISNYGLDVNQTPRKNTVCQYVVLDEAPLEVKDMTRDERFKDEVYVTEDPRIHYYYGVPLTTPDGVRIGAMCVMDRKQNDLSPEKEEFLKIIANEVITHFEYEHKLKFMSTKIEELMEMRRKVSHDIRGPVGGIIGLAEVLYEIAEESEMEEFMELLQLINKGGNSVLELADEILSNYKDQVNQKYIGANTLSLKQLEKKLLDLYQPQALSKELSYSVTIEEKNTDSTFPKHNLLQIIGNLVTNAIKFTPEGGNVNVELSIIKQEKLSIIVKDDGIGMNKDQLSKILSDEAKSTAGTQQERGFGFGFQLARHLTQSMDGELNINSKPNEGTTIELSIPI